jgi:hypothetical protein
MPCAHRAVLISSMLLACARSTSPGTVPEAESVASICESDRLDACVEACFDATCLDWCAGSSCRVAVGEVHACMNEVERAFESVHPEPQFSPAKDVDEATLQALALEWFQASQAWTAAHEAVIDNGWAGVCRAECLEQVGSSGLCDLDTPDYETWSYTQMTCSAPMRGDWVPYSYVERLERLPPGVSLALVGAREGEMKWGAVSRLVAVQAESVHDALGCSNGIEPVELVFDVELAKSGTPTRAKLVEGEPGTGACVAAILERGLALPSAIVAEFPRLAIRVQLRPAQ